MEFDKGELKTKMQQSLCTKSNKLKNRYFTPDCISMAP